ncbi:hypothetical protein L6452_01723 [Arctium lappa]|uniref:Uncharacterized protein n=1 Tax=Arctium lappa TaxID=4217 RepID=A0ACB9FHJ7_ARCLA|nr:hypothetical protein L6452_01723 [Arctium lappa]
MLGKTTPPFNSIKSPPADYRFMDSHGKFRNNNGSMISYSIPKNDGAAGNDNVDDSRYGHGSTILRNERPFMDYKDVNPSTSHLNSILPSRGWDDIYVYNVRKVPLAAGCQGLE